MRRNDNAVIGMILGFVLIVFGVASCSQSEFGDKHGIRDAPVEPAADQNNLPAHVITFPDTFANVLFKCDGKNGLYVTSRDAAPVVVANDPNCAPK